MEGKRLAQLLKQNKAPQVIDVRSGFEYRSGHIPGAIHLPLFKLLFRLARPPVDVSAEYVIVCEHGPRAQMVQGFLARKGFTNLQLLSGHMSAWRSRGYPLEQ
ncbi:MAG: rhodanese-like domain-containing protein [Desulfuromonas sp.]|nr:MAG: rhodanese-like domain-containing protein [Desulfuromonas sp.]